MERCKDEKTDKKGMKEQMNGWEENEKEITEGGKDRKKRRDGFIKRVERSSEVRKNEKEWKDENLKKG